MEKTIRAGIIGCGKVGPFHAAAYQRIDGCELCAVYDVQPDRAEAFAQKYGAKAYTSVEAMVKECGLDVVSVCTPHPIHRQAAVEALRCGAKRSAPEIGGASNQAARAGSMPCGRSRCDG